MRVECTECPFSEVVEVDDGDELPDEVVVKHGSETGHTFALDPIEN